MSSFQPDGHGGTTPARFAGQVTSIGADPSTNTYHSVACRIVRVSWWPLVRDAVAYFTNTADATAACATLNASANPERERYEVLNPT